ncbi:hypothetical protein MKX03_005154 [Papaver bracteatum]|nr:hypothetical protein MKX03_005154 [Papaver bracteatum]
MASSSNQAPLPLFEDANEVPANWSQVHESYFIELMLDKVQICGPRSAREKYNHAYSSLRNIIERCFGVIKARFPILKMMPSYSLRKQRNIVIASCAIHNFIRRHAMEDDLFIEYGVEDMTIPGEGPSDPSEITTYANLSASESQRRRREMDSYREGIRTGMSLHYRLPM